MLLQSVWDQERNQIFEPMPFKGDENMLDDSAKNRAAMDDDEGEQDLLFGVGAGGETANGQDASKKADNAAGGGDNLIDLNMMLGTTPADNQNQIQNSGLLDLIGGGPQGQAMGGGGGGLLDMGMGMPA